MHRCVHITAIILSLSVQSIFLSHILPPEVSTELTPQTPCLSSCLVSPYLITQLNLSIFCPQSFHFNSFLCFLKCPSPIMSKNYSFWREITLLFCRYYNVGYQLLNWTGESLRSQPYSKNYGQLMKAGRRSGPPQGRGFQCPKSQP